MHYPNFSLATVLSELFYYYPSQPQYLFYYKQLFRFASASLLSVTVCSLQLFLSFFSDPSCLLILTTTIYSFLLFAYRCYTILLVEPVLKGLLMACAHILAVVK
ncbi:hypothetical protein BX070DRAFT_8190 [Coemansia spiralis]|nr:hypothetical protein BX070DRAFT_8190 [Coemansia spiralis]